MVGDAGVGAIRVERDVYAPGVATVTIDHAARRNAISRAMWDELHKTFTDFQHEGPKGLRAVVIQGAPDGNAFSPGADITEFPELRGTTEKALLYKRQTQVTLDAIAACHVPIVAVVDGPCIGAGFEIALAADLRVASDRSTFGLPVVRLANAAELHDIARLVQVVGYSLASEVLLSASTLSAARLYGVGALSWVGPAGELETTARELVGKIASAAPKAVRLAKRGLRMVAHVSDEDRSFYREGIREVLSGSDFAEGTRAFLERRAPVFSGD